MQSNKLNFIFRYIKMNLFKQNDEQIFHSKAISDYKLFENKLLFKESSLTGDNKTKDLLEVRPKNLKLDKDTIHIVKLYTNNWWQARVKEIAARSIDNNAVVIAVNDVTFDISKAVKKSIMAVESLLSKGVDSKNIVLEGLCLAGAVATRTVKHFHDKGIKLNLYNDRSFAKSDRVFTNSVLEGISKRFGFLRWLIKKVLGGIEKFLARIHNSDVDVGKDFKELWKSEPERVNYSVIRSQKDQSGKIYERDQTISYDNSIHACLKDERIRIKKPLKEAIAILKDKDYLKRLENKDIVKLLQEKVTEYKSLKENIFEKKENILLLNEGISKIEKENDIEGALKFFVSTVKKINGTHKFESIYKDELKPVHGLNGQFLINRAFNNTLHKNDHIENDRIKDKIITKFSSTDSQSIIINRKESVFEGFVNNIRKLNEIERQIPTVFLQKRNIKDMKMSI